MRKRILCVTAAILLLGCSSSAASDRPPGTSSGTASSPADPGVIPESDDFFTDMTIEETPSETAPETPSAVSTQTPQPENTEDTFTPEDMPEETAVPLPEPVPEYTLSEVSPSDFDYYKTVKQDGIPSDVVFPSLKYAEGSWKYCLNLHDDSPAGYSFIEYGYADLALDRVNQEVVITLHPRFGGDGYELWEENDEMIGYEPFRGGMEDGALKLNGNNIALYITHYYTYEGREYVQATAWFTEESSGDFLMTRGQE